MFLGRLSKPGRLALGILSIWPILYLFAFMGFVFFSVFFRESRPVGGREGFALVFVFHFLTMLLIMALLAAFIVDVFKNDRVEKDKKPLWAVVLFMGGIVAFPIYWYLYVWSEPTAGTSAAAASAPGAR